MSISLTLSYTHKYTYTVYSSQFARKKQKKQQKKSHKPAFCINKYQSETINKLCVLKIKQQQHRIAAEGTAKDRDGQSEREPARETHTRAMNA